MGNKGSTESPHTLGGLTASHQREENPYEFYTPDAVPSSSKARTSSSLPPTSAGTPPPLQRSLEHRSRPHGLERRSMTVVGDRSRSAELQRGIHSQSRRLSTSDAILSPDTSTQQDSLQAHIVESGPQAGEEGVELAVVIAVTFDKDVRTVNTNKLFEVKCDLENVDSALKPVQGRCTFDSKTQRAEFTPHHTLHPNATYTVTLLGPAVTTTQCLSSGKVSNALITFKTCDPPPKNIGIKLKGQKGEVEKLQIANYYDLYNSLIGWSTRQWGCSGEHITGMFVESEERGKLLPLKADHDVLRLRENEIVVVEIKD